MKAKQFAFTAKNSKNFEFELQGIRFRKAYSVGQGKTVNYSNIVRTPQGPTSMVIKDDQSFFYISVKRNLMGKRLT